MFLWIPLSTQVFGVVKCVSAKFHQNLPWLVTSTELLVLASRQSTVVASSSAPSSEGYIKSGMLPALQRAYALVPLLLSHVPV